MESPKRTWVNAVAATLISFVLVEAVLLAWTQASLHRERKLERTMETLLRAQITDPALLRTHVFRRRDDGFSKPDALLGYRVASNRILYDSTGYYISDAQGFLATEIPPQPVERRKARGTFRILMLGGSSVFGLGVRQPADSLPAQLQAELRRRRPGERWQVVNAGVCGYWSAQEALWYLTELERYQADLVVFYDGANDFAYSNRDVMGQRDDYLPLITPSQRAMQARLDETYRVGGSARLWMQRVLAANPWMRDFLVTRQRQAVASDMARPLVYDPRSIQAWRGNLELVLFLAGRRNQRIACFLQPVLGLPGQRLLPAQQRSIPQVQALVPFYRAARALYARLNEEQGRRGRAGLWDLSDVLKDSPEAYVDAVHLTRPGNRRVASAMADCLFSGGLIP